MKNRMLIFHVTDDASEDIIRSYAESLLETAENDELYSGIPTPFDEHYFIGNMQEFLDEHKCLDIVKTQENS